MRIIALLCFGLFCGHHSKALNDTLSAKEIAELRQALLQTPLGANLQADTYSLKGDSAKAGEYLLKSDAYYMMFLNQTPETLPEFLSTFKSSKTDKDKYIELFTKAYNEPKNEYYHTFRKMRAEDQKIRYQLNSCSKDSCKLLHKLKNITDSIHAAYLYSYVKKNGWPTMKNGGLFANTLAIHDYQNYAFYIPNLKSAIKQGQNTMDALEIISYYNSRERERDYLLQTSLDTTQKLAFDVSSLLNFRLPTSISEIRKAFKDHCPVDYYLVFYTYRNEIYHNWMTSAEARRHQDSQGHILEQFFSRARKDCPRYKGDVGATWGINWLPSDTRRSKIMLYVLYN